MTALSFLDVLDDLGDSDPVVLAALVLCALMIALTLLLALALFRFGPRRAADDPLFHLDRGPRPLRRHT